MLYDIPEEAIIGYLEIQVNRLYLSDFSNYFVSEFKAQFKNTISV